MTEWLVPEDDDFSKFNKLAILTKTVMDITETRYRKLENSKKYEKRKIAEQVLKEIEVGIDPANRDKKIRNFVLSSYD